MTSLDILGHEVSHGVCANTAGLHYSGESGGINEANSDINGTFVAYYAYGSAAGSMIPDQIPAGAGGGYQPWTIGSQVTEGGVPLRYMYRPSLDLFSADYWFPQIGDMNVHESSGPANRMMFFLSCGATTSGDTSTSVNLPMASVPYPNFLPYGMHGIGNDHAGRIWYRALTTYMNSGETYLQLRDDCLSAAQDLYGDLSPEYEAVQNAFAGINVGLPAVDVTAPSVSVEGVMWDGSTLSFTASASDNTAVEQVEYYLDGVLRASSSNGGDWSATLSFPLSVGDHVLVIKAYDPSGNVGTSNPFHFVLNDPDENHSGEVDGVDMGLLANAFGSTGYTFDLTCDGRVDENDLVLFLDAFAR